MNKIITLLLVLSSFTIFSQNYYFEDYQPFNKEIPSPEEFLGYPIGEYHTRHDLVVSYMYKLAELSDKASISVYGLTNENRKLVMLTITSLENHKNITAIKEKHLKVVDEHTNITDFTDLPIFVNLGYGVHGNEPSSTEAAMLTAYTLIASKDEKVKEYLKEAIFFIDPTINPDGRDRHTNWVNNFRGNHLVADKYDIEHNEGWPRGRTNHYWFDLNRDLLLGVMPESNDRLKWYHDWYPNVVTDFHEMGTNSTYFFEPKNKSAAENPITPAENRNVLNKVFAEQFSKDLDEIGSLYFTDEVYDSTYPGYGSTYMDLQGSLALLFEQASSRGHLQETPTGTISFPFTIRNQFISSFATIKASIKNKNLLYNYQNKFFKKSIEKAAKSRVKGYIFGEDYDKNRAKAFLDLLLKHKIKVYGLTNDLSLNNKKYKAKNSYIVPTKQKQHYLVQSLFETYNKYRDSVYYDASAWSLVNFYNMKYSKLTKTPSLGTEMTFANTIVKTDEFEKSDYAYVIPWDDYYTPAVLNSLQQKGVLVKTSTKSFTTTANGHDTHFDRGALLIPVGIQKISKETLYEIVTTNCEKYNVQGFSVNTGFTIKGTGLGSRSFKMLQKPRAMMLVEGDVSSYEAGEVWYLFDQRMQMPLSKVPERLFSSVDLSKYNVIILVSGKYKGLDEKDKDKLKNWIGKGNTLITIAKASSWAVKNKIVNESLVKKEKDSLKIPERLDYADIRGTRGKQSIGGAIFKVDLDITNPLGYGYHNRKLPVYKNNSVWLKPSKSEFLTVAKYTDNPHIDGYITKENLKKMSKSASILISKVGEGRVVLFADNPNFRGAWYGTNKLFMNAVFFGSLLSAD
ncbi:MAG TPA: zinc carboxypeptidase [Flavobacteriaceae bacterium]|jgi:hypothetical protein|nr:zinc carboxypeptidase [Flavobacteriaceae bacterium]